MKNLRPFLRSSTLRALIVPLASISLVAGCITQEQVQSIVTESNYQTLTADADVSAVQLHANPEEADAPPDEVIRRIETFIMQHPDQPAMTSPLRLRQAVLFLNQKEFSSAQAAFDAVIPGALNTERDQSLHRLSSTLLWWYEHADERAGSFIAEMEAAKKHMASVTDEAAKLKASPELRDLLIEAHGWIAIKLAGATQDGERAKWLEKAINSYGTVLSQPELKQLSTDNVDAKVPAFTRSVRVVQRGNRLLDAAAGLVQRTHPPQFAEPLLQAGLDARIRARP